MQRKLTVLRVTVAGVFIAFFLIFSLNWYHSHSKLHTSKWLPSVEWNTWREKENGFSLSSRPKKNNDLESPKSKPGYETFLGMTPYYISAIMNPKDDNFPRLACPVPAVIRYDRLLIDSNVIPQAQHRRPTYFFALNLHQCAELLPRLIGSIVEAIRFLGPKHCALSIVEGRSDDGTFEILHSLREQIEGIGATYYFESSDIDPTAGDGINVLARIKSLAELRNLALQPLLDHADQASPGDTTVIFINDVAICMEDILELIYQRSYQNADMTCAMDWTYVGRDATFYDVWIARGMNGDTFFNIPKDGSWDSAWDIFWNNPIARERQQLGKPFQVFSCWNGATAFTAKPYLESKMRFRASGGGECPQGEPKTWCADLWHLGYGKIAVVPSVNLEYSDEGGRKVKAAKGYVSKYVSKFVGLEGDEEKIEWEATPPSSVKCIPNGAYENQTWSPWEEQLVEKDSRP